MGMSKVQQYEERPGEGIYRRSDGSRLTNWTARVEITPWGVLVTGRLRDGRPLRLSMSLVRFRRLHWPWRLGRGATDVRLVTHEVLAAMLELSGIVSLGEIGSKSKLD